MDTKKKLHILPIILVIALLLTMSACTKSETPRDIEDCYQIHANSDLTYSYEITNLSGKVIYSESSVRKAPTIKPLSPSVLAVSAQTGTGLSTNRAVFCDVQNSIVSETFYYVLGAKDGYVFYVENKDKVHTIICRNIFDSTVPAQEYKVEDEFVVLDSFSEADFEINGVAKISYLTSDSVITQKYITISFHD